MNRRRLITISFIIAALVFADRYIKLLAQSGISAKWWIARFGLFRNYNLVFSWPLSNMVGIIGMFLAMAVVLWLGWHWWRQMKYRLALGAALMFLGATSNFFDRVRFGFVIDWGYLGPWWPIFNLADVLIATGLVLVLFSFGLDKKGSSM